jgi:putative PEP-CTERM system TPR-repeat lipoprotein
MPISRVRKYLSQNKRPMNHFLVYLFCFSVYLYNFSALASVINTHYEKALISFNKSEFDSAKIHLKNALSQPSEHLPSRILNARLLLVLGKGSLVEVELKKAELAGADKAYISTYLMDAFLLQRKFDEVLSFVDEYFYTFNNVNRNVFLLYKAQALLGNKYFNKADQIFVEVLQKSPDNLKALIGRAQVALKKGRLIQSKIFIKQAMKVDENHINVLLMSAVVHQMTGEVDTATKNVKRALKINPKSSPARLIYSVLLLESGDLLKAKNELEQILAIIPNEPGVNFLKYLTNISLGDTNESAKTIDHLINVLGSVPDVIKDDFPIFYYLSSLVNFQQGNHETAYRSLIKYMKINNEDIDAKKLHVKITIAQNNFIEAESVLSKLVIYKKADIEVFSLFGKVLMVLGKYEKAEYYFKQTSELQPDQIKPIINLAKLYMISGQYSKVISSLISHIKLTESSEGLLLLSKAYIEVGKPKVALIYINDLLITLPSDSYIHQLKGSALGLSGDMYHAKKSYQDALVFSPENSQAVIHLARIDVFENNVDEAIARLTNYNEVFGPNNSAVLIELGDIYLGNQNKNLAKNIYLKALAINQYSFLAFTRLVSIYQKEKEIENAIELTNKFILSNKKNSQVYAILGKLYYQNKNNIKANDVFDRAIKYSAKKELILLDLANFQIGLGHLLPAKNKLVRAIAWSNKFVPAYDKLIALVIALKDEDYAVQLIGQLESIIGNVAKIDQFKGDLFSMLGDLNKSQNYYLTSLDKGASQQAVLGLYRIYKQKNENEKIISLLSSWLKERPSDLISAIALTETYHVTEQYQIALNQYLVLLEMYPNNPVLLNNIALVYLSLQQKTKAASMAELAYKLLPDSVTILDTKAWIEINRENYQQALALLRLAYSFEHENAEVNYHLAIVLDKLGRREEASSYLQQAAMTSTFFPEKQYAILMLKQWSTL